MTNMNIRRWVAAGIVFCAAMLGPVQASAGDLEDGISTYTDDSVSKDDEVFKNEKNIKYIMQKAKSQASKDKNTGAEPGVATSGGGNMNSVVLGPGSEVKGDVIIIDNSRGPKTQVTTDGIHR